MVVSHAQSPRGPWTELPALALRVGVTGFQEFNFGRWIDDASAPHGRRLKITRALSLSSP